MADKARILVADDDKLVRAFLSDAIEHFGYSAILASDGEEALAKVRSVPPDLILLDVMMPKKNGMQVARELKGNPATSGIPIIIITSLPEMPAGMVGFAEACLKKPFRIEDLSKHMRRLLPVGGASPKPSNQPQSTPSHPAVRP